MTPEGTLSEFLLARIAEDADHAGSVHLSPCAEFQNEDCTCDYAAHVLAECEAKRRIVEMAKTASDREMVSVPVLSLTLRALALPYANHPDFREEWRP